MFYSKKTTNKSFIGLWRELQRCNVENNIFPLQTNEKALNTYNLEEMIYIINDKDKKLSADVFKVITKECVENVWFYFREILYLKDQLSDCDSDEPIHFEITKRICYMLYLYSKNKSFIIINPNKDEEIALKLLWNYHRSIITDDLVLIKERESETGLFKELANLTSYMPIKMLMGGSQVLTSGNGHTTLINDDTYKEFPNKFSTEDIDRKISTLQKIDNAYPTVFSFNNFCKVYAYLFQKRDSVKIYGVLKEPMRINENKMFYYTSKAFIPQVTDKIFDTPDGELYDIYYI